MHVIFCLWAGGRWLWPSRITGVQAVASGLILVSVGSLICSWRVVGKNLQTSGKMLSEWVVGRAQHKVPGAVLHCYCQLCLNIGVHHPHSRSLLF